MTTLRDHAYNLAQAYPGGAAALALRMGRNATTLQHELRGTGTAKLGLEDAAALTAFACDRRILAAWAAEEGQLLLPMPVISDVDASQCMRRLSATAQEFADLVAVATADLSDNQVSDNELARIEREASELYAAIHGLLKAVRDLHAASKPPATGVHPC